MAKKKHWWKALALGAGGLAVVGIRFARARRALKGLVVLVTGGSRGLGLLVAEEFGRAGCRIAICARDVEELEGARQKLEASAPEVVTFVCDVNVQEDVDRMIVAALSRFGHIDVLVNNAGIIQVGSVAHLSLADFERAVTVNFWGAVRTSLAALPHMKERRSGHIVNITSIGGMVAVPHLLPYDCAKFALVGFSEGLGAELANTGVAVTTVVPGLMRTGSEKVADRKTRGDALWFGFAARLPGLAMSPRRAAKRIVSATAARRAEVVLGVPAKLLRLAHHLFPNITLRLLGATARALPR
jgi:short-subunit dehydrogenase